VTGECTRERRSRGLVVGVGLAAGMTFALGCAGAGGPGSGAPDGDGAGRDAGPGARAPAPGPGGEESPFPSPEELESLAREGTPEVGALVDERFAEVERWTLTGPLPERVGEEPVGDPGPWEQLLLEVARDRAGLVVVSEAMRCVAREIGLFVREHDALPGWGLRDFIVGRCGATGVGLRMGTVAATVPPDAPDERIASGWGPQLAQAIRENLGAGARAAGIWFGRRVDRGLALVVTAERRARVEPTAVVAADDDSVSIRGELLRPAQGLEAQVNQGRLGVARCEPDPSVLLPRFALRCPVRADDETAWITVSARSAGRLLPDSALKILARPAGDAARTWQRADYGGVGEVTSAEGFREGLVEAVNRLRVQADLPPLVLETHESRTAERLAPLYMGAGLGALDPSAGDLVALGLIAGWEVGGVIRDAGVGAYLTLETRDLGLWLGEALLEPGIRGVLLSSERTRLAVGPIVSPDRPFLAAVVASYALYGDQDPAELREQFYVYLDRTLDQRGLRFPRRDRTLEAVAARHAARVAGGAATPQEAAASLANEAAAQLRTDVQVWPLEGSAADQVLLPPELLEGDTARIAAAVTWYQPAGSPWGRTVVLLVAAPDAPLRTATPKTGDAKTGDAEDGGRSPEKT